MRSVHGIVFPQGRRKFETGLAELLIDPAGAGLSPRIVELLGQMQAEWRDLDWRIADLDEEFATRDHVHFGAQWQAGLCAPLPTLRRHPRG
jgi:hypothetical protein